MTLIAPREDAVTLRVHPWLDLCPERVRGRARFACGVARFSAMFTVLGSIGEKAWG